MVPTAVAAVGLVSEGVAAILALEPVILTRLFSLATSSRLYRMRHLLNEIDPSPLQLYPPPMDLASDYQSGDTGAARHFANSIFSSRAEALHLDFKW